MRVFAFVFVAGWSIPNNPESWTHLRHLGVDIINTDKVAECRKYFSSVAQ